MADNKYLSKTELVEFIKNLSLIYATNEKADVVGFKQQLNEKLLPALINAFQNVAWIGDDLTGQKYIDAITSALTFTDAAVDDSIYNLTAVTFSPDKNNAIDTGIKLLSDTTKNYTAFFDVTLGNCPKLTASDSYCFFHCMTEVSPWPGLSVSVWPSKKIGVNFFAGSNSFCDLAPKGHYRFVIRLNNVEKKVSYCSNQSSVLGYTSVSSMANDDYKLDETLVLGGYKDASGNIGRVLDGTFNKFYLYDYYKSDEECQKWVTSSDL